MHIKLVIQFRDWGLNSDEDIQYSYEIFARFYGRILYEYGALRKFPFLSRV